jgi:subtilisin-like proprotein convertase family protein
MPSAAVRRLAPPALALASALAAGACVPADEGEAVQEAASFIADHCDIIDTTCTTGTVHCAGLVPGSRLTPSQGPQTVADAGGEAAWQFDLPHDGYRNAVDICDPDTASCSRESVPPARIPPTCVAGAEATDLPRSFTYAQYAASDITLDAPGQNRLAIASVDVRAPNIGNVDVSLEGPGVDRPFVVLHENSGWAEQQLVRRYGVRLDAPRAGTWSLVVATSGPPGTLRAFHLETFALCENLEYCPVEPRLCPGNALYTGNLKIPDNDSQGVTIERPLTDPAGNPISADNVVGTVAVAVTIQHPFIGDLEIDLVCPSGAVAPLRTRQGGSDDDIDTVFETAACTGTNANGTWKLVVRDRAGADVGTIQRVAITTQPLCR